MNVMTKEESVVVVEGYDDRSFWKGWLSRLGVAGLGEQKRGDRVRVEDPWGVNVTHGEFGYRSPVGRFIRVVPCEGWPSNIKKAALRLAPSMRRMKPVRRLVLCRDLDLPAVTGEAGTEQGFVLINWARTLDSAAISPAGEPHEALLDGGATAVSLIKWSSPDQPGAGIPCLNTLERLVCCAYSAVYPKRGEAVSQWLTTRPEVENQVEEKAHAWSFMAGWFTDHGQGDFYSAIWRDDLVAAQLQTRLEKTGAWAVAERLVS
ncbi:MAG: hypothetical protein HY719_06005 [Planctomycetes bacterium]|nr:hypothetical protein [Planctomycetota bacterium]